MGFWCGVVKILGMHLFLQNVVFFQREIGMVFCVGGRCLIVVLVYGFGFGLVGILLML